jgi:hypothetical protein
MEGRSGLVDSCAKCGNFFQTPRKAFRNAPRLRKFRDFFPKTPVSAADVGGEEAQTRTSMTRKDTGRYSAHGRTAEKQRGSRSMPYYRCWRCGLRVYSAASVSTCPECSARLEPGDRVFEASHLALPLLAESPPAGRTHEKKESWRKTA